MRVVGIHGEFNYLELLNILLLFSSFLRAVDNYRKAIDLLQKSEGMTLKMITH